MRCPSRSGLIAAGVESAGEYGQSSDPQLEQRVLRIVLRWFTAGLVSSALIMSVHAVTGGHGTLTVWIGVAGALALALLGFLQRPLGYRRTLCIYVGGVFVLTTYLQSFRGLVPGPLLGNMASVLLAGLFFGTRGVLVGCFATAASLIVAWYLVTSRILVPWHSSFWDPFEPLVWLRYVVILAFFGGGVAHAILMMTADLRQIARRLRDTLALERNERAQREAAQRALEKAQRLQALGQFAAGMAHDFNNSVAVITADAELIRMTPNLSPEVASAAGEIIARAEVAAETLRQLMALGRDETGKPTRIDLDAVLQRSLPTLRHALGANVELAVESAGRLEALIDASRLQQLLLNLALNARDAMPNGGKWTLSLREHRIDAIPPGWAAQPGQFATLECTDTGTGMDQALRDRIFEPFFTTKPAGQGTGLGLAMVHKTVLDAGG
ncbi:MAG TPA: ATP-binding protein, partial [Polyangiales bacterium]|nr:ATP-binding protein [Polyangiales bacterium]